MSLKTLRDVQITEQLVLWLPEKRLLLLPAQVREDAPSELEAQIHVMATVFGEWFEDEDFARYRVVWLEEGERLSVAATPVFVKLQ